MNKISVGSRVCHIPRNNFIPKVQRKYAVGDKVSFLNSFGHRFVGTVIDFFQAAFDDCGDKKVAEKKYYVYHVDFGGQKAWYKENELESASSSDISKNNEQGLQTYTAGDLKNLLNKMDDSIKFTFSDLKIHFG